MSRFDKIVADSTQVKHDREVAALKTLVRITQDKYQQCLSELSLADKRTAVLEAVDARAHRELEKPKRGTMHDSAVVLVLTDWHVEETVDPATVNGLNRYNLDIAARRIGAVVDKFLVMLDVWRQKWPVKQLVVALLGDMITGYIHEELVEGNSLSPSEAILFASEHIDAALRKIKKESGIKEILVPTCFGNHGRSTPKMRIATGYKNSYEWLMYSQLAQVWAADPVVKWKVEKGYHNWLSVCGVEVRLHHGDAIRYGGGVGGITIPVNKIIAQWNKSRRAHLDLFGHWHQFLNHRRWVSCDALIGYGPFAQRIGAEFQEPAQTMVVLSRSKANVAALQVFVD